LIGQLMAAMRQLQTALIIAKGFCMDAVAYRKEEIDGINIFYREAGRKEAPTILLLHGFPTAGHMFRDLIPQLADRYGPLRAGDSCEGDRGSDPRLPCAPNVPLDREVVAARWLHPPKRRFTRTATYAKVGIRPFEFVPVAQRIEQRFPNSSAFPSREGAYSNENARKCRFMPQQTFIWQ
jgi:hypothetical protein